MTDATKPAGEQSFVDRCFALTESGTSVRVEFVAGLTTFLTMVYIVFVNPQIPGNAGMDKEAAFVATCLAAAVSTLVVALYANIRSRWRPEWGSTPSSPSPSCSPTSIRGSRRSVPSGRSSGLATALSIATEARNLKTLTLQGALRP